ncbi:MAG TPA: hypothetical protein VGF30_16800 [Bacteroidia bacterium]
MRPAFIAFIFIVFAFTARSQNEFAAGYYLNAKNDTIKGEVKLFTKNEMDYYVKMFFRPLNIHTGGGKQMLPAKIHGYGVEDRHYASVKLLEMWVFMQVICTGKVTLFEYKPPVAMGNEKMESQYYVVRAGEEMEQIFISSKVRKQIRPYISDDKELMKEIEGQEMHYAELVDVITRYNERNQ